MVRTMVALMLGVTLGGNGATVALAQSPSTPQVSRPTATVPLETTNPTPRPKAVIGKVKAVKGTSLVIEVSGTTPEQYTFALVGTLIKISEKEGTSTDLKEGTTVEVTYTESGGKRIAKTVTDRPTRVRGQ